MRLHRVRLLLAVLVLCLPASARAEGGAGVAAGDFMEIPVGARDIALGGATASLPGDIAGLFRNPALLAGDARRAGLSLRRSRKSMTPSLFRSAEAGVAVV